MALVIVATVTVWVLHDAAVGVSSLLLPGMYLIAVSSGLSAWFFGAIWFKLSMSLSLLVAGLCILLLIGAGLYWQAVLTFGTYQAIAFAPYLLRQIVERLRAESPRRR